MRHSTLSKKDRINFLKSVPQPDTMAEEIHSGLARDNKTLPPKYFYDKQGSELFDRITDLDEYYLTRTEIGLLEQHIAEIADLLGKNSLLIELGSGSSIKIRFLLEAIRPKAYVPVDISYAHLLAAAQRLANDYPWLTINPVCIDYSKLWSIPISDTGRRNAFFPGSSIGNFSPSAALDLLKKVHSVVGERGGLLIGVDLKKDAERLEAAYNDAAGITAAFNLNILRHINRRLDADFDLDNFTHRALYNEPAGRVEMHLSSKTPHQVQVQGERYDFKRGETIHTENSYKYTVEEFHQLAALANFTPLKTWTDPLSLFSLHYLVAH